MPWKCVLFPARWGHPDRPPATKACLSVPSFSSSLATALVSSQSQDQSWTSSQDLFPHRPGPVFSLGGGCKGHRWALRAAFCSSRHRAGVGPSTVTKSGGSFLPEASLTWGLPLSTSGRAQSRSPVCLADGLTPPCLLPSRYTPSCPGASALASVRLELGPAPAAEAAGFQVVLLNLEGSCPWRTYVR